jgi:hypothetical protein
MRHKKNTTETLTALNAMELEPVSADIVSNSQIRAWNDMSHKIKLLNEKKMTGQDNQQLDISKKTGFKFLIPALGIGLAAIILVSIGTYTYIHFGNNKLNIPQNQAVSNADLTEQQLSDKAEKRFKDIFGVSYADVQAISKNPTLPISEQNIDASKVKDFSNKNSLNKVYYTEEEYFLNDPTQDQFVIKSLGAPNLPIDKTKPIILKTWMNVNYSKSIVLQNGKILSLLIETPKYKLEYQGGKYAVKSNIPEDFYFAGYLHHFNNGDANFLLSILNKNGYYKKIGEDTVNNKKVAIYREKTKQDDGYRGETQTEEIINEVKYYIDTSNLTLERVEIVQNGKVVETETLKNTQILDLDNTLSSMTSYDEIKPIEVKEINILIQNFFGMSQIKYVDAISRYNIYYSTDISEPVSSLYDSGLAQEQDDYGNLTNTKDFNPGYKNDSTDSYYANYSQSTLQYKITTNDPGIKDLQVNNYKITAQSDIKISVDGILVDAKYYELTYSFEGKGTSIAKAIIFQSPSSHKWYTLDSNGEIQDPNLHFDKNLKLISLSYEKAKQIDDEFTAYQNAQPLVAPTTLDKVQPDLLFTPGDLSTKYKLFAASISKSLKPANQSKCEINPETPDKNCIIEKYNGFELVYASNSKSINQIIEPDSSNPESPNTTSGFSFMLLDTKLSNVEPYFTTWKNRYKDMHTPYNLFYKEIDGKTVMIEGMITLKDSEDILNNISLGKDLEILKNQILNAGPSHPSGI